MRQPLYYCLLPTAYCLLPIALRVFTADLSELPLDRVKGRLRVTFAVRQSPAGLHRAVRLAAVPADLRVRPAVDHRADDEGQVIKAADQVVVEPRLSLRRVGIARDARQAGHLFIKVLTVVAVEKQVVIPGGVVFAVEPDRMPEILRQLFPQPLDIGFRILLALQPV